MPPLGERFRAAREARGLSLSDVAEQIRIRSVYLSAIEDENWGAIGAPVYIRGFLRTYARFLGLNPEEMVAAFNDTTGEHPAPVMPSPPGKASEVYLGTERPSRNLSPLIWIASVIAVLLVAFVFYNEFTLHQRQGPAAAVAESTPGAAASEEPSSAPMDGPGGVASQVSPGASPSPVAATTPLPAHLLQVTISSPSWLRITVDGNVSMEGTFPAGTVKQFHGKNAVLRIGNAGGVEVSVDGKNLGKLGSAGDVVERSFAL